MSGTQQSQGLKSPGPNGLAAELSASVVALPVRTVSTVLRVASCRRVFRPATQLVGNYEIGSSIDSVRRWPLR